MNSRFALYAILILLVGVCLVSACKKDPPIPGPGPDPDPTNAPAAPANLRAEQPSETSVLLFWDDSSDDEDGFKIERSTSPAGGFTEVYTTTANDHATSVADLNPATTYYFRVRAFNSAGHSAYTNTANEKTLAAQTSAPVAPSGLQATQPSQSSVVLSWQDNSNNEAGFKIERSLSSSTGFTEVYTVATGVNTTSIANLNPATRYYFRLRAHNSGGNSDYSNTANATTLTADTEAPPSMSGPASNPTSGQHFELEWTYDWTPCTFCPSTDGYRLEESSTSATGGFTTIWESYLTGDRETPRTLVITPRAAGTYWYRVRAFDNGWSDYSNVVQVTVVALVSSTQFVNNTSYPIVSLKINGQEQFPVSPMGIVPGGSFTLELSPGTYQITASNGFWDGSSRFAMYNYSGSVTQQSGVAGRMTFSDPTIRQLLTRFGNSGYWEGEYYVGTTFHLAGFRFFANGKWDLYVDNDKFSSGTYSLVSRSPSTFTVDFTVGDNTGTLDELHGYFFMSNGPADWRTIKYTYQGAAAATPTGPIDVPMNVTISASAN